MFHIQASAETAVREMLKQIVPNSPTSRSPLDGLDGPLVLQASDFLDDGTEICLTVSIDQTLGSAIFDFAGTGAQVFGNLNAPRYPTPQS